MNVIDTESLKHFGLKEVHYSNVQYVVNIKKRENDD